MPEDSAVGYLSVLTPEAVAGDYCWRLQRNQRTRNSRCTGSHVPHGSLLPDALHLLFLLGPPTKATHHVILNL
jgi:hypothetical protein